MIASINIVDTLCSIENAILPFSSYVRALAASVSLSPTPFQHTFALNAWSAVGSAKVQVPGRAGYFSLGLLTGTCLYVHIPPPHPAPNVPPQCPRALAVKQ